MEQASKLLKATQLRIKAGKLAPSEVMQQQAQIANLKITLTRGNNTMLQDYRNLLILLGLNPRSNLQIDRNIAIQSKPLHCPNEAIEIALCNNIEYQRLLLRLKQLELLLLVAKDEQRWKLDLIGKTQRQFIFAPVDSNQLDAIGNDKPANDRTLILNLNIPLHDVNRKQNFIRSKIALQQFKIELEQQRQQLVAEVLNTLQNLETQTNQIKLARDAVNYSEQSLAIAQKKFLYGRTTMFEVTSLQQNLIQQQLAFISEQIAYLNNTSDFEKLLGYP